MAEKPDDSLGEPGRRYRRCNSPSAAEAIDSSPHPTIHRVAAIWQGVCLLNFAAYVITAIILGGDAWNGRIRDGHYYLAWHGRLMEVSRAVFEFSWWHTFALWTIWAIMAVLGVLERTSRGVRRGNKGGSHRPEYNPTGARSSRPDHLCEPTQAHRSGRRCPE
jgi:hypothetical protein